MLLRLSMGNLRGHKSKSAYNKNSDLNRALVICSRLQISVLSNCHLPTPWNARS